MKKILFVLVLLIPVVCYSQNNDGTKKITKFEEFSSKTGSITKFIDTSMPNISTSYANLETSIRTIIGSQRNTYFYRIEKSETDQSTSHTAMIEYSDLLEINKALSRLSSEVNSDIQSNPDYLENKFVTVDGFEIGYYVVKGEATWYMKLERYTNSSVFMENTDDIILALKNAQLKIEKLKIKYGK